MDREWIKHDGKACPVHAMQAVEVQFDDGDVHTDIASSWEWGGIAAYRVIDCPVWRV